LVEWLLDANNPGDRKFWKRDEQAKWGILSGQEML
jgi:hypothetical protein